MAEKTAALAGWVAYLQRKSGGDVAHIQGRNAKRWAVRNTLEQGANRVLRMPASDAPTCEHR